MKLAKLLAPGLVLGFVLGLGGCRVNHLGSDTAGHTYRAAFAAQRNGDETVEPPALSAEDAKQVMVVHRTGETKGSSSSASTTILAPATLSSGSLTSTGGGGSWPGASGNITLEAK